MATAAAAPPTAPAATAVSSTAPSLFECFINVPHPAASKSCQPMSVIAGPGSDLDQRLLAQIQSFCFPEYEEATGRPPAQQQQQQARSTAEYKSMYLNRFDQYAMQPKSFTSFTFTLQLQDGRRLYGHVRRTLPTHFKAPTRYDIGRRGERALVLLTQTAGAGQLYHAILKSVDAISSLNMAVNPSLCKVKDPEKQFLHALHREQQRMSAHYQKSPAEQRGKPLIAALSGLEVQESPLYAQHDINRFMVPTCLLQNSGDARNGASGQPPTADTTSSVLPLLRCVGVAHALRVFAALLSERRVILTSSSPTRLSTCSHAALAMLQCGLLHWQHLYIPVLPPHLWQYLAAPYPYLIGILDSAIPKLDHTDGLGEVLIVNLDSNSMETRNIPQQVVAQRLPDLFSSADPGYYHDGSPHRHDKDIPPSASEFLAQDLLEILKTDKKTLYGEVSTVANLGETAGKAAKAIKSGFGKLKARLKGQHSQSEGAEEEEKEKAEQAPADGEAKSVADDYIFTEGCHNEVGEQETRLAFACFFLALLGNMRWYLNSPGQGQVPVLDRNRFLEQKRLGGDGQGSALWPLLQNFCQTQMFEEFAKARVEEVRSRSVAPADSPLFAQCAQYHRHHNIDFGVSSVRSVARQVAQANPGRLTGLLQTNARRMAMSLTSNKNFEGDYSRAVAQLVDQCRESSSVLFDVMSVIWLRVRDCRGLHWKHGYQALQLLKNLLYHGPLAAVVEATDGLEKIRSLRAYEHMRSGVAQDIRKSAAAVYSLLVDRAKLWMVRRVFAEKRRQMVLPAAKKMKLLKMDRNVRPTHPIDYIHAQFHPLARPTIAPIPPPQRPAAPPVQHAQPQQARQPVNDPFGLGTGGAPAPPPQTNPAVNQDLMGLFGDMAVSPAPAQPSAAAPTFDAQPTIVSLPPKAAAPVPTTAPTPQPVAQAPRAATQQQYYNGAPAPQQQQWAQQPPPQQQQWAAQGQTQQRPATQQPSPFGAPPQQQAQYQQPPPFGAPPQQGQYQPQPGQPQQQQYYQQNPASPPQYAAQPAAQPQQAFGHAQQQHQQAQANLFAAQQRPPQQQQPPAAPAPAPVNPKQFDPFAGM